MSANEARSDSHYGRAALLALGALAIYRAVVVALSPYGLDGDEAQYWTWAQTLDFGYYSKPPMVAWIIAATTGVCGDSVFCIRIAAPFLHFATGLLVFLIAERLYGARVGLWSALAYSLMPAVSLYGIAITTDTPLLLFWALALYAFLRAIDEDRWRWWLLLGIAGGLGLLSKYSMAFFAVSALLYLLLSPRHRHHLARGRIYTAGLLALLIYLPNLLWNARHGFVSYRHTHHISHLDRAIWHLQGLGEFISAQFLVFGPLPFALLLYLIARRRGWWTDSRQQVLMCFAVPWLLVVLIIALMSRAHANWAMPIYVAAAVWITAWLLGSGRPGWLRLSLALQLLLAIVAYHYDAIAPRLGVELTRTTDPYQRYRGWEQAGRQVATVLQRYPEIGVLTDQRMTTALLLYYARPAELVKWNANGRIDDHYELTTSLQHRQGDHFLLVTRRPPERVRTIVESFDNALLVDRIRVPVHRDAMLTLDVYLLSSFRGYPSASLRQDQ